MCEHRSRIVKFTRLNDDTTKPTYGTQYSSGLDLYASEDFALVPGDRKLIPTGISMEIPTGFEGQVRPRSGMAVKHGVTVLNSPGTIDSDYRGEIKVLLFNSSRETFSAIKGHRIAQLVLAPVYNAHLMEVDALPSSERGGGGFGHTGD